MDYATEAAIKFVRSFLDKDTDNPRDRKARYFLEQKIQGAAFDAFIQTTPVPKGEMLEVLLDKFGKF